MTQVIPFIRSGLTPPTFLVTLDRDQYTIVVTFNVAAQRWYINVYASDGSWVCTVPLIETPPGVPLTKMRYDPDEGVIIATKVRRFWRSPGQIVRYTIVGCTPEALNGTHECLTLGPDHFSFPFAGGNPGVISVLGSAHRLVNLVAGYFKTSTLIFREGMFEANP